MREKQGEDDWRQTPLTRAQVQAGWSILTASIAALVLIALGAEIFKADSRVFADSGQGGFIAGLFASLIGTIATVGILDATARARNTKKERENLIYDMGSPDNGTAIRAVRDLQKRRWRDVRKGDFIGANLENADLGDFDFRGALLVQANLRKSILIGADLRGADLCGADLRDAMLQYPNEVAVPTAEQFLELSREKSLRDLEEDIGRPLSEYLAEFGRTRNRVTMDERTVLPDTNNWTVHSDLGIYTDPASIYYVNRADGIKFLKFFGVVTLPTGLTLARSEWDELFTSLNRKPTADFWLGDRVAQGPNEMTPRSPRLSLDGASALIDFDVRAQYIDPFKSDILYHTIELDLQTDPQSHIDPCLEGSLEPEDLAEAARVAAVIEFTFMFTVRHDPVLKQQPNWTKERMSAFAEMSVRSIGYGDSRIANAHARQFIRRNLAKWERPPEGV